MNRQQAPRTQPAAAGLSRRTFLRNASALAVGAMVGLPARAFASIKDPQTIAFEHLWTGERIDVTYKAATGYVPEALARIDEVLRDHRTEEVHRIDPALVDQLGEIARRTGTKAPFQVICGYRSPTTNDMLRSRSKGVAKKSMHLEGRAIDVRLPDVSSRELRRIALGLKRGGVGYYRSSNFVHLDTGAFRSW